MNNIIQTIRHTARAAAVLLLALLAAQTAWAEEDIPEVSNADGLEEAFNDPTVSEINVTDNITDVDNTLSLSWHDLTIYLDGHTISGDELSFNANGCKLTINGGGQDGSVGNIISGNADEPAIDNTYYGTVTLRNVNITTNYDRAIQGPGTLNIGNNVSFNGWTSEPFDTPNVNTEDGNYSGNVVATVNVGGTPHYFENSDIADDYAKKTGGVVDLSWSESDDTYTIHTAAGWNAFCDLLANNAQGFFTGKTVKLGADITVSRMAGGDNHEFTGTFDGNKKTLTVSISSSDGNAAPFREIMGATIRNLKVSGSVSGHKHSAGLVSYARGADSSVENTIENCLVATDVSTIVDTDGDCYLGGIVGHGFNSKLTIRGCAFTGSLTSPHNYTGGLQGWSDGNTLILEDDIFAASSVNAANVGFHPIAFHVNNATTTATVTNVYYTVVPTCTAATRIAAAGQQARTLAAGDNVTLALSGTATEYNVSGITAYEGNPGIKYGTTYYAGSGEEVSLTLSAEREGYAFKGYQASAGTLSGSENPYTLTMPDADVSITANWTMIITYIDADGKPQTIDSYTVLNGDYNVNIPAGWYVVTGSDVRYNSIQCNSGDVYLVLCDGAKLTVGTNNGAQGIELTNGSLTIYGQALGTGQLHASSTVEGIHAKGNITVNGGSVEASSTGEGIDADGNITINGGCVEASSTASTNGSGIYAKGNITINGGCVEASSTASTNGSGIYADNITLAGGIVKASPYSPWNTVTIPSYLFYTDGEGKIYTGTLNKTAKESIAGMTMQPGLQLSENNYNSTTINNYDGKTIDVRLKDRTLYKDGDWNTLCLPFDVDDLSVSPLAGATVKELDTEGTYDTDRQTGYDEETGTLYLYFKDATEIKAGVPYLVKWESGENIVDPIFSGATISKDIAEVESVDGKVQFRGIYEFVRLEGGDRSSLYLGAGNKLYWPSQERYIGGFRGYFHVDLGENNVAGVKEFRMNLDGETTSVRNVEYMSHSEASEAGATYNLSGQRVHEGYKGIKIRNGKKTL